MEAHKKIAFSTVGPANVEKKKVKKTVRLTITLPESNEKCCPEYHYGELLTQSKKKKSLDSVSDTSVLSAPTLHPNDPLMDPDCEEDQLQALARKLEQKYANTYNSSKKRKRERRDSNFIALGEGYDENDSFIDNTGAYDEVLPSDKEAKFGGFYINSGELDYKDMTFSDEEDTKDTVIKSSAKVNKRKITSDSEEDTRGSVGSETGSKKDGIELLRKRRKLISKMNAKRVNGEMTNRETNGNEGTNKENNGDNKSSLALSIESVLSKAREEPPKASAPPRRESTKSEPNESSSDDSSDSSSDDDDSSDSSSSSSESDDAKPDEVETESKAAPPPPPAPAVALPVVPPVKETEPPPPSVSLPQGLPQALVQVIEEVVKEGLAVGNASSSQKFFTERVKKLLLSIETKLVECGGRYKMAVYNYLSHHTPCHAQTLVKRAKQVLIESREVLPEEHLRRLKALLQIEMEPLKTAFVLECEKFSEKHPDMFWEIRNHLWGKDASTTDEEKKKIKMPKRKYTFSEEAKKHLLTAVRCKVSQLGDTPRDTSEVLITSFLETEVRPLWPKGWITTKQLYKVTAPSHAAITESVSEASKRSPVPKKVLAVAPFSSPKASMSPITKPVPSKASFESSTALTIDSVIKASVALTTKPSSSTNKTKHSNSNLPDITKVPPKVPDAVPKLAIPSMEELRLLSTEELAKIVAQQKVEEIKGIKQKALGYKAADSYSSKVSQPQTNGHPVNAEVTDWSNKLPISLRPELTISYKGLTEQSTSKEKTLPRANDMTITKVKDSGGAKEKALGVSKDTEVTKSKNIKEKSVSKAKNSTLSKPVDLSVRNVKDLVRVADNSISKPEDLSNSVAKVSLGKDVNGVVITPCDKKPLVSIKSVNSINKMDSIRETSSKKSGDTVIDLSSDEEMNNSKGNSYLNSSREVNLVKSSTNHLSTSRDNNHHNTSRDNNHHNTSRDNNHHNTSRDNNHHNISRDNNHHNTSRDNNHHNTSRDTNHHNTSRDTNHHSTSRDNNHYSTSRESNHISTSRDKIHHSSSREKVRAPKPFVEGKTNGEKGKSSTPSSVVRAPPSVDSNPKGSVTNFRPPKSLQISEMSVSSMEGRREDSGKGSSSKLMEEMDDVMNELLQISKQKTQSPGKEEDSVASKVDTTHKSKGSAEPAYSKESRAASGQSTSPTEMSPKIKGMSPLMKLQQHHRQQQLLNKKQAEMLKQAEQEAKRQLYQKNKQESNQSLDKRNFQDKLLIENMLREQEKQTKHIGKSKQTDKYREDKGNRYPKELTKGGREEMSPNYKYPQHSSTSYSPMRGAINLSPPNKVSPKHSFSIATLATSSAKPEPVRVSKAYSPTGGATSSLDREYGVLSSQQRELLMKQQQDIWRQQRTSSTTSSPYFPSSAPTQAEVDLYSATRLAAPQHRPVFIPGTKSPNQKKL